MLYVETALSIASVTRHRMLRRTSNLLQVYRGEKRMVQLKAPFRMSIRKSGLREQYYVVSAPVDRVLHQGGMLWVHSAYGTGSSSCSTSPSSSCLVGAS